MTPYRTALILVALLVCASATAQVENLPVIPEQPAPGDEPESKVTADQRDSLAFAFDATGEYVAPDNNPHAIAIHAPFEP